MQGSKKEEIIDKIANEKELLSTMPQNNEKNKRLYLEELKKAKKKYSKYEKDIMKILEERYENGISIKENDEIQELHKKINKLIDVLSKLNNKQTSYEKMGIDKKIFLISRFYKENLENINSQILECLNLFESVGIKLNKNDFDYSEYVYQYMEVFLEEKNKKDGIDSEKLKEKFEEIYWKCSDIIIHIELNLRYLYLKNEKQIDKYFENYKKEIMRESNKDSKEILEEIVDLEKKKHDLILVDRKNILDKFLSGKMIVKNYIEDKVNANINKIMQEGKTDSFSYENLIKYLNSIYEYKNYLRFKYIIDDVKKYYLSKEEYKKVDLETRKKIDENEKKLKNLNNRINGKGFLWFKKDNTKKTIEQNELIQELRKLYKKYELNKFYNKIYTELKDDSTLYDLLFLACSYYTYIATCIGEHDKDLTQAEIDEEILTLFKFLNKSENTIINNITIIDEKDLALVIKDRYNLMDFELEKNDLNPENIDNLIDSLQNIKNAYAIKQSGLELKEIDELIAIKKKLKK